MEKILIYLLCAEIIFILLLFLGEVAKDKIDYLYMSFITNPKSDFRLHILGDSIYMIGGSVTGAGIYEYISKGDFLFFVLAYGIIFIIIGASLRSHYRKDKK
jgi:hypothetical protein